MHFTNIISENKYRVVRFASLRNLNQKVALSSNEKSHIFFLFAGANFLIINEQWLNDEDK